MPVNNSNITRQRLRFLDKLNYQKLKVVRNAIYERIIYHDLFLTGTRLKQCSGFTRWEDYMSLKTFIRSIWIPARFKKRWFYISYHDIEILIMQICDMFKKFQWQSQPEPSI